MSPCFPRLSTLPSETVVPAKHTGEMLIENELERKRRPPRLVSRAVAVSSELADDSRLKWHNVDEPRNTPTGTEVITSQSIFST